MAQTSTRPRRPDLDRARAWIRDAVRRYAAGEERPLEGYGVLIATYGAVAASAALLMRRRLPERVEPADILLLGVATFKVSRHLARDPVLSPLRAPVVEYEGRTGPSEITERPRKDTPFHHALGELVTCPFCIGQWVSTALVTGLVMAPRATRVVAATMSVAAIADALQLAQNAAVSPAPR